MLHNEEQVHFSFRKGTKNIVYKEALKFCTVIDSSLLLLVVKSQIYCNPKSMYVIL